MFIYKVSNLESEKCNAEAQLKDADTRYIDAKKTWHGTTARLNYLNDLWATVKGSRSRGKETHSEAEKKANAELARGKWYFTVEKSNDSTQIGQVRLCLPSFSGCLTIKRIKISRFNVV